MSRGPSRAGTAPRALLLLAMLCAPGCSGKGGGTPDAGGSCEMPSVQPSQLPAGARRFALSVFHFNLEYVMGGLDADPVTGPGGDRYGAFCGSTCAGWDNDAVEDWIIRESFVPVIDFYLEHPQWGATIELQAYFIEVLAERFPEVIPKLRTLAGRGQIELASFHYADQLFLAFPRRDLLRSQAMTREIFSKTCLPLSGVVFDQEGQAGAGWLTFLGEQGYSIGLFPKNLFRYQHGADVIWWPLYQASEGGAQMVIGPGNVDPSSGIELAWPFFDDGELLAVNGGLAPYLAPIIEFDPARLEAFAAKLTALEDQGFEITTVTAAVEAMARAGVVARPVPPLLDGTWQAPSTDSIKRWLGGRGQTPYWDQEQDNAVRSSNTRASLMLAAARLAHDRARALRPGIARPDFEAADRDLFHAEVSDGSGVNPWAGEIFWSLDHSARVLDFATAVLEHARRTLGVPHLLIDLEAGTVVGVDALPTEALFDVPAVIAGVTTEAGGRAVTPRWQEVEGDPGRHRLTLVFAAGRDPDLDRILKVTFPRTEERLRFSPALIEDATVDWPLTDFTLDWGETYLPLPNGLIGLGDDRFVIKHNRVQHLAARIEARAGAAPVIEFIDEVAPLQETTWVFEIVSGDAAKALKIARAINTHPTIHY